MTIANGNETSDRLCWWERPFLDALAHRPVVTHAAAAATVSRETVYRHRRESSRFAAAWDEAVASAIGNLEVKAYDVADDGDGPMLRWILSRRKPAEWGNQGKAPPPADAPDDADVSPADAEPNDLSPVAFAREVLGVDLSDQQVEMLALIYANRRTALAGAHASGKTYAVAIFILWWVWTYTESIALVTATKLDQTDRLWNEIRHFWNISPRLRAGLGPTAELLDRTLRITEYRYIERFTAAVSKSGGDAQATGAQGAHVPSGRVLVDIEEADGVQLATYNALEGSMSSANAKMVMQFNPLRRSGPAYNATRSDQWATMHISGFDSPNLAGESVETLMERYDANPDDPWFDEESHNGLTGRRYMLDLWLRCGVHGDRDWYGRGLGVYAPQGERSIFDANQVEALVVPQEFNRPPRPTPGTSCASASTGRRPAGGRICNRSGSTHAGRRTLDQPPNHQPGRRHAGMGDGNDWKISVLHVRHRH